jgi:AraC family transcriptional regulator
MMDPIERAIEMMTAEREERTAMQDIAAAIGLSPVAFSRLFTAAHGIGPLAYARRLRLERAAEELATPPGRALVEVALDAGFESQQTFTRAFTAMFGMPPGEFRKTVPAWRQKMKSKGPIEPEFSEHVITSLPRRRFAGKRVEIDGLSGMTPASAWAGLTYPVPGQVLGMSFGVCFSETAGGISGYMACVELQAGAAVPPGLELLELPAERYFVVRQKMPADSFGAHLAAGLARLWGELLPRAGVEPSGNPDLEGYPDDLNAGRTSGWLTHMVPIKA